MSEQPDDTTEPGAGSRPERAPQPGSYYYDDATGYEIYAPERDEEAANAEHDEARAEENNA